MHSRYQPIKNISEGSFGRVYLAVDTVSGENVAIKELKQTDQSSISRFARELRVLKEQINNQCVVDVLDYDLQAAPPFIVMEYCEHGSLRGWVRDRKPWRTIVESLGYITQGLAGIHKAGGFHRDIKPDNLLLKALDDGSTITKVADFGLARIPNPASDTMTFSAAGTPGYIAPEIMMGADFHSGADIYSLGVVALELLSGGRDLAKFVGLNVPEALKSLVTSMLSPVASKRPNLQRVAEVLERLLEPPVQKALVPSGPTNLQRSVPDPAKLALLGAGAALLIGGLAYLALNAPEWDEQVGRYRGKDGRFKSG